MILLYENLYNLPQNCLRQKSFLMFKIILKKKNAQRFASEVDVKR